MRTLHHILSLRREWLVANEFSGAGAERSRLGAGPERRRLPVESPNIPDSGLDMAPRRPGVGPPRAPEPAPSEVLGRVQRSVDSAISALSNVADNSPET